MAKPNQGHERAVVYEIVRYRGGATEPVERFRVVSDGTTLHRVDEDGIEIPCRTHMLTDVIADDPLLNRVRSGEWTRVTTDARLDELPLLLCAPPGYVEDPDEPGVILHQWGDPLVRYGDREIEVNGERWVVLDGAVLPSGDLRCPRLDETWAELTFDGALSSGDGSYLHECRIGLVNPKVVVQMYPSWDSDGGTGIAISPRGDDARDIHRWLTSSAPPEAERSTHYSGDDDGVRLLTQLFVEAVDAPGRHKVATGDYLGAGIAEYSTSFAVNGTWDLKLNLPSDTVRRTLALLAHDTGLAAIVNARRDPDSATGRRRRAALDELG